MSLEHGNFGNHLGDRILKGVEVLRHDDESAGPPMTLSR